MGYTGCRVVVGLGVEWLQLITRMVVIVVRGSVHREGRRSLCLMVVYGGRRLVFGYMPPDYRM